MLSLAVMLSCSSHVRLSVTCQATLSMGFSRQENWSGLLCPAPGDLPHPGTEPVSLVSPALAGRFSTASATWEALLWQSACSQFILTMYSFICLPGVLVVARGTFIVLCELFCWVMQA